MNTFRTVAGFVYMIAMVLLITLVRGWDVIADAEDGAA